MLISWRVSHGAHSCFRTTQGLVISSERFTMSLSQPRESGAGASTHNNKVTWSARLVGWVFRGFFGLLPIFHGTSGMGR